MRQTSEEQVLTLPARSFLFLRLRTFDGQHISLRDAGHSEEVRFAARNQKREEGGEIALG